MIREDDIPNGHDVNLVLKIQKGNKTCLSSLHKEEQVMERVFGFIGLGVIR